VNTRLYHIKPNMSTGRIKPCKILPKLVLSCHLRSYRELEDVAWQENGL